MAKLYTITLNGVTEETYNQAGSIIFRKRTASESTPVVSTIDVGISRMTSIPRSPELPDPRGTRPAIF